MFEKLKEIESENNASILFCFSGTGNSLKVALKLKENMINCTILSITKSLSENNFEFKASRIGFIFPVYFIDIPTVVKKFLGRIKILGNPYIFAVATCGGEVGKTFKRVNKILLKQDKKLNGEFKIVFPSNSIVMFNKTETPEEISRKIQNTRQFMDIIVENINQNRNVVFTDTKVPLSNRLMCWMGKSFLYKLINDRTFKVDENKCTLCGSCVAVCPMNNIEINNGKVTWTHNCECCAACIHWCPNRAIENINTSDVIRYHHPEITIKMMKSYKK